MNKQPESVTEKLIEKFDHQLRDILSAEIRSVRYARTQIMNQLGINQPSANLTVA